MATRPATIGAVKGHLQTSTANIDIQKPRMPITRRDRVFPVNRGHLRSSRASSQDNLCRRRPAPRQRSTHYCSRAEHRLTGILIVMISRQRATAQRPAGRSTGLWALIILKVHIEILRRLGDMVGPRMQEPQAVPHSSPRVRMVHQARIPSGILHRRVRLVHPTQDHRSHRIRAMSGVVPLSRRRNHQVHLVPVWVRALPAPCRPHRTPSTLHICRPMGRNHRHIRGIRHSRGLLSRPHQMHTIQIRI